MTKIYVLQMDNRLTLDYLILTKKVNEKICQLFNYHYYFMDSSNIYLEIHPIMKKICFIYDFLNSNINCDILVFLDSDAWIQNGYALNIIIEDLMKKDDKIGCYSRDPFIIRNTYINSGAFILKNNNETREMYQNILNFLKEHPEYIYEYHPYYDQPAISHYVYNNREKFIIFNIEIFNTPIGSVIRHNWHKSKRMYDDLNALLLLLSENNYKSLETKFIVNDNIDNNEFPNKTNGEDYSYLM